MAKTEIDLVILSPSTEVNKLRFPAISTSTTVEELRERITVAVLTHPAPGRQRLIYRGHALIDAKRTLRDIFTQEIIDASETLSLHLVLPPENGIQPSLSSTSTHTPNHVQRSRTSQLSPGGFGTLGSPPSPPQGSGLPSMQIPTSHTNIAPPQPQAQHDQAQHIHGHAMLPNTQIPPQLQQAFMQFQAINQQLAAVGANPGLQAMGPNQAQVQVIQQPHVAQPSPLPTMPQQSQQAMAPGAQSLSEMLAQQPTQANQAENPAAQRNVQGSVRSSTPGNTDSNVQGNHGMNGERWQMVIQSGQMNIAPIHGQPAISPSHLGEGSPRHTSSAARGSQLSQSSNTSVALIHLQSSLSAMETAMAGGNPLPESIFEQVRDRLEGITHLPDDVRLSLNSRLSSLADRAERLREALNDHLTRAAQERVAAQRTTQGPQSSAVYVLASPSGPQALLVSPTGFYSASWQPSSLSSTTPYSFIHHHSNNIAAPAQSTSIPNPPREQQPANYATQAQQPAPQQVNAVQNEQGQPQIHQHRQQHQQQHHQQANQARDLLRILLPLGGHLWLLIRLFGFVYFFTAGAGWRRTILLGLVASLVFVAQTGIFRPVIQAIWDPIRRHAEGLVPLAANERLVAGGAGGGIGANAANTPSTNQEPSPREAAERLLQERERRDVNFVSQTIRRIERAIALFVASLVPGVGERHIAAREAAEAARQVEAREREERARREEEEARQQQQAGEDTQSSTTAGQDQSGHPPLVEI